MPKMFHAFNNTVVDRFMFPDNGQLNNTKFWFEDVEKYETQVALFSHQSPKSPPLNYMNLKIHNVHIRSHGSMRLFQPDYPGFTYDDFLEFFLRNVTIEMNMQVSTEKDLSDGDRYPVILVQNTSI
jgi:hypothetical protein